MRNMTMSKVRQHVHALRLLLPLLLALLLAACPPSGGPDGYAFGALLAVGPNPAAQENAGGATTPSKRVAGSREAVQAAAETDISLRTFTPTAPFRGNQVALVAGALDSGTTFTSAILVREPNCSLTQYAITPAAAPATSISATLPGAGTYLHQLAGLTTMPGRFPRGCIDRRLGQAASPVAFLGRNAGGDLLSVVADFRGSIALVRGSVAGVLLERTQLVTSGAATTLATADLNGDGIGDIVSPFVAAGDSGGIGVFLSRADGTFAPVEVLPVYGPTTGRFGPSVSIEDLNGDGRLDLVAVDRTFIEATFPAVVTLLGTGSGRFGTANVTRPAIDTGAHLLADFTGDGRVDLLTAGGTLAPGNGDGTFAPAVQRLDAFIGGGSLNAVAGDFDADGALDVAFRSGTLLTIFMGRGDGTFATGASYAAIRGANALNVTDINGDGNLDIVVGLASQGVYGTDDDTRTVVQFLFGHGDGRFFAAQALPGAGLGLEMAPTFALADFSGDGVVDIVTTPPGTAGGLVLQRGSAEAVFSAPAAIPGTSGRALLVASGDFDGDGRPDVVTSANGLTVLRGLGGGTFAAPSSIALPVVQGSLDNLGAGDVDGDGRSDVVVLLGGQSALTGGAFLYRANADGSLRPPVQIDASTNLQALAIADVNSDGRADVAVGGLDTMGFRGPDRLVGVRLYRGNADGSVGSPLTLAVAAGARSDVPALGIGDMNRDGRPDLVVATRDAGLNDFLRVLPGANDGSFGAGAPFPLPEGGPGVRALVVADYSDDGNPDVLVAGSYAAVVHGIGDGGFGGTNSITIGSIASHVAAADLNGDAKMDAVVSVFLEGLVPLVRTVSALDGVEPPDVPPFTLASTASSGSAASGQSVQTTLNLTFAAGFGEAVALSCANLPANARCEFAPASVTPAAGGATSVLTIRTGVSSSVVMLAPQRKAGSGAGDAGDRGLPAPMQAAVGGVALALLLPRKRRRGERAFQPFRARAQHPRGHAARRHLRAWAAIVVLAVAAGCGGGDGAAGTVTMPMPVVTPAGTYDVTINATAAGRTSTLTYRLTVR